jgi:hypothetical protein
MTSANRAITAAESTPQLINSIPQPANLAIISRLAALLFNDLARKIPENAA